MPELANLNVYVSALLFVLGAYLLALYVGLIVWTYRDVRARSRDVLAHITAPLLVAVFTLPGLLVYVLLRYIAHLSQWQHSFIRLFGLVRACLWTRLDLLATLQSYGTAGGSFSLLAAPQQAYLLGFEPG